MSIKDRSSRPWRRRIDPDADAETKVESVGLMGCALLLVMFPQLVLWLPGG